MSQSDPLLVEWPQPSICVLRLNRPEAYNALSVELVNDLRCAVALIVGEGARVMVLAATKPGFCSGADLKQRKTMTDAQKYAHNRAISALADEIAALPIPTIAAINGIAMGGGTELPLACDIRFTSSDAKIGLTEARIGAMPGAGGTQRLPRLIGTARALEIMYSGEPITADTAAAWGLVNSTHTPDDLERHTLAFAESLAGRSRTSTAMLKSVVYNGLDVSLREGLELERKAIVTILSSEDYKEGLAAFAERRPPNFS